MSAQQRVKHGLCDPVRLFVKNEPHKQEKLSCGRYRLICSVSIVDFCVEKWFSKAQNEREISMWFNVPSMSGMGLTDEGIRIIYNRVASALEKEDLETSDVIGWDQSVQAEELRNEAESRIALRTGSYEPSGDATANTWANGVRNRTEVSMRAVRVTSDGYFWEALDDGIMLSGSANTASSNSRIRWTISQLERETLGWGICMGDDSVTSARPNSKEFYATIGHPLKDVVTLKRTPYAQAQFEFCSHVFKLNQDGMPIAEPINWEKSLYRLLCHPFSEEMLGQFKYTMRHSSSLERCLRVLRSVGWTSEIINSRQNATEAENRGIIREVETVGVGQASRSPTCHN